MFPWRLSPTILVDEDACHGGRDCHDRPDREVHPACRDDEGHPDREHDGRGAVAQDVDQAPVQVAVLHLEVEEATNEYEVEQQDDRERQHGDEEPALDDPTQVDGRAERLHASLSAITRMIAWSST